MITTRNSRTATALAAVAVAAMLTAAARPASACGPDSDETAVEWAVNSMFTTRLSEPNTSGAVGGAAPKWTDADFAGAYPDLTATEIDIMRIGDTARTRVRWTLVDNKKARAIVEVVDQVPGCRGSAPTTVTAHYEVSLVKGRARWQWKPTKIARVSPERVAALAMADKVSAATSRLMASVSARLATR